MRSFDPNGEEQCIEFCVFTFSCNTPAFPCFLCREWKDNVEARGQVESCVFFAFSSYSSFSKWKRFAVRLFIQPSSHDTDEEDAESTILIHAWLRSQGYQKTASTLVKELQKADPPLHYDVVVESSSKSGAEILGMVRARLDLEK